MFESVWERQICSPLVVHNMYKNNKKKSLLCVRATKRKKDGLISEYKYKKNIQTNGLAWLLLDLCLDVYINNYEL